MIIRAPSLSKHLTLAQTQIITALLYATLVGIGVFLASLLGIITRPSGFLASFWPANPLLLGLLLRRPRLAHPFTWVMAAVGFVAADLLFDHSLLKIIWLSGANLVSVAVGYLLLRGLDEDDKRLLRPRSVLYLFLACVIAAMATAFVGCWSEPILFGRDAFTGWRVWFSSELANSMAILPMVLSAPSLRWRLKDLRLRRSADIRLLWPVLMLIASLLASILIGGPGAVAFPIPALLWCAIRSDVFSTTVLTWLTTTWMMIAIGLGWIDLAVVDAFSETLLSIRIGVTLMSLGPIAVACNTVASNALMRRLHDSATRDMLTNALTRAAFTQQGHALIEDLALHDRSVAILMFDLDKFKSINDTYGHATGDHVLSTFARLVGRGLRDTDLFGRLGGEEFAAIMPGIANSNALIVAEGIREAFAQSWNLEGDMPLQATVSIGMTTTAHVRASLESMLAEADRALYQAKATGRNRVVSAETLDSTPLVT